jgi:exopolyphosphatase/guanosine-5'-triphosphate,3'-diphosphate pyrophosphatase
MTRTIQALRICQKKLESTASRRMRLVATEACRRAQRPRLHPPGPRETGLPLEIIAPEEEARLAVISCAPLVNRQDRAASGRRYRRRLDRAGLDRPVGGAARGPAAAIMRLHMGFEPARATARRRGWSTGFRCKLGVATLKDQFADVEDDAARFALMSWFFEEKLASFRPYHAQAPREGFQIIGTSGTVTTVAASLAEPAPL